MQATKMTVLSGSVWGGTTTTTTTNNKNKKATKLNQNTFSTGL